MAPIKSGNSTGYIKVQNEIDPYRNVSRPPKEGDKYDPSRIFSRESSLANKTFSASDISLSKKDSALDPSEQQSDLVKPYMGSLGQADQSVKNLNTKADVSASSPYNQNQSAQGFDKDFTTSAANLSPNQTTPLYASMTSPDQGRMAVLEKQTSPTFASALGSKTYQGVEAEAMHRELARMNQGLMQVKDLPSRPLTIDEVRALINHGVKPSTDSRPEPESKPLNDPDYKPEPLREMPPPSVEDDKNDPVPPPGMMAQPAPENSEPLPDKH